MSQVLLPIPNSGLADRLRQRVAAHAKMGGNYLMYDAGEARLDASIADELEANARTIGAQLRRMCKPPKLPRISEKMMRAAAGALYGSDDLDRAVGPSGLTFRDAMLRMWAGIRQAYGDGGDAEAPEWRPIESAPQWPDRRCFLVRATFEDINYRTDPWVVFRDCDNHFARWTHKRPPTEWMAIPGYTRLD